MVVTAEATLGASGMDRARTTTTIATIAILVTTAVTKKLAMKVARTTRSTGGIRAGRIGSHHIREHQIHCQ